MMKALMPLLLLAFGSVPALVSGAARDVMLVTYFEGNSPTAECTAGDQDIIRAAVLAAQRRQLRGHSTGRRLAYDPRDPWW